MLIKKRMIRRKKQNFYPDVIYPLCTRLQDEFKIIVDGVTEEALYSAKIIAECFYFDEQPHVIPTNTRGVELYFEGDLEGVKDVQLFIGHDGETIWFKDEPNDIEMMKFLEELKEYRKSMLIKKEIVFF